MTAQEPDSYYAQIERANKLMDARRAGIAQRVAEGTLTRRRAADQWITLVEEHLAALRDLRAMHHGTEGRSG